MTGPTRRTDMERKIEIEITVPAALRRLLEGDAETPTEAVEQANPSLGPAARADAAWVVEKAAEKAETAYCDVCEETVSVKWLKDSRPRHPWCSECGVRLSRSAITGGDR